MGLGRIEQDQNRRIYLSFYNGKVERSENGTKEYFSFVEGYLHSIYSKIRNYGGEDVLKWFIELKDESGDLYTISFPYSSGTFKSIILSLASETKLTDKTILRIEPYKKDNFTNVTVWADGIKLDWISKDLPPVTTVKLGEKEIRDDTKRMEYIRLLTETINGRISSVTGKREDPENSNTSNMSNISNTSNISNMSNNNNTIKR